MANSITWVQDLVAEGGVEVRLSDLCLLSDGQPGSLVDSGGGDASFQSYVERGHRSLFLEIFHICQFLEISILSPKHRMMNLCSGENHTLCHGKAVLLPNLR